MNKNQQVKNQQMTKNQQVKNQQMTKNQQAKNQIPVYSKKNRKMKIHDYSSFRDTDTP